MELGIGRGRFSEGLLLKGHPSFLLGIVFLRKEGVLRRFFLFTSTPSDEYVVFRIVEWLYLFLDFVGFLWFLLQSLGILFPRKIGCGFLFALIDLGNHPLRLPFLMRLFFGREISILLPHKVFHYSLLLLSNLTFAETLHLHFWPQCVLFFFFLLLNMFVVNKGKIVEVAETQLQPQSLLLLEVHRELHYFHCL